MDGNGRWATRRGLSRLAGHRRGKDSARTVIEVARELGIPYLTLFAFSNENWRRPPGEVSFLMALLRRYLMTETKRLCKRGIKLIILGDQTKLPPTVRMVLDEATRLTARNSAMTLALALSYGGRQEIVCAVKDIARAAARGELDPEQIDESLIASRLETWALPDPDLLIRTSGELRLSNFLLFQLAYTELYFTETLWPDFGEREFLSALVAYQNRERRFGAVQTSD
jgi:undecaprenyl diphosphate synthase